MSGARAKQLAYLAGFLDGEGCIMLPAVKLTHHRSNRLVVVVDNTCDAALVRFAGEFGGSVVQIKPSRFNQRGHFRWTVTDKRAEQVLQTLLPYLHVKRDQAEVALAFRKTVRRTGKATPHKLLEERRPLVERIRKLNARGTGVPLRVVGGSRG